LLAIALAVASTAVACGSSSKSASTTTTTTTTKLTGSPVTIGVIYTKDEAAGLEASRVEDSIKAAVAALEARGGLDGHPIKIRTCTTGGNDPNGGARCANELVGDPALVAVVGSSTSNGDAVNPILEKAGVANIAATPLSSSDYSSPINFPVFGGAAIGPGVATLLTDVFHLKKISLAYPDLAATAALPVLFNSALKPRGLEVGTQVKLPLDKQDLSAEAAQLAKGADGIAVTASSEQFARLMKSGRSSGAWPKSLKVGTFTATLTDEVIKSLGSDAEGIYAPALMAIVDSKSPGVTRYLAELKKYGAHNVVSLAEDDIVKSAWLGVQVLAAATKGMATIDRTSVLAAMNKLQFDSEGMTPPLDFSKINKTVFGGALPRLFNTTVMYGVIKDGKVHALTGKFVDPFEKPSK
jgi:ABC-type branched-subunit amino acid transport system substrate-binding protein